MAPDGRAVADLSILTKRQRILSRLIPVGLGAALALGQSPWSFWWVALAALVAICRLAPLSQGARAGFWFGWLVGVGHFAVALSWIVEPFLVDFARHGWMAPFALVLLSGGLALFWGAAFAAAARWGGVLALPVFWALAELARGYVLTGFPWAMVGYIWLDTPVRLMAALIGSYGLSFLTMGLAALAAWRARSWLPQIGAAVGLGAVFGLGLFLERPEPSRPDAPIVRIVQPNAPQEQKWDREMIPVFFQRHIALSRAAPLPDLVIWSETALPMLLEYADEAFEIMQSAAPGVPILTGIQRRDAAGHYFNSLVVLDGTGQAPQVYDKHHLVPFGEYMPLSWLADRFGIHGLAAVLGGYTAGPGPQVLDLGPLGRILPLICYEVVFPQDVRAAPVRPDMLVQITNDAWFGKYSGPYQHLAQAQMRAVEQGLPLLRAANTGISAVIDGQGRITGAVPLGVADALDLPIPAAFPPTLYAATGDWVLLFVLLGAAAAAILRKRQNSV